MSATDEVYFTNADIMRKLNEISEKQATQAAAIEEHHRVLENMGLSVRELQDWQIAFKAAEAALANMKLSKSLLNEESPYVTLNKSLLKVIGQVVALVAGIITVVYLYVDKLL
ncbi:MAG: hypothetical protein LC803_09305 [Acidobacteria bacterium]|nr:hypothetical protein [Acidobacteriota bacterium]